MRRKILHIIIWLILVMILMGAIIDKSPSAFGVCMMFAGIYFAIWRKEKWIRITAPVLGFILLIIGIASEKPLPPIKKAELKAELGEYMEAIKILKNIPETDTLFPKAQSLLTLYMEEGKKYYLKKIDKLLQEGEIEEALNLAGVSRELIGEENYEKIREKASEILKERYLAEIKKLLDEGTDESINKALTLAEEKRQIIGEDNYKRIEKEAKFIKVKRIINELKGKLAMAESFYIIKDTYLREYPFWDARKVKFLKHHTGLTLNTIKCIKYDEEWSFGYKDGDTGFVYSAYLRNKKDLDDVISNVFEKLFMTFQPRWELYKYSAHPWIYDYKKEGNEEKVLAILKGIYFDVYGVKREGYFAILFKHAIGSDEFKYNPEWSFYHAPSMDEILWAVQMMKVECSW